MNPTNSAVQHPQMNQGWIYPQLFRKPNPRFGVMEPPRGGFNRSLGQRYNWKGKEYHHGKGRNMMMMQVHKSLTGKLNVYNPPMLVNDLQQQNRGALKPRKFIPNNKHHLRPRFHPFAPRNTTSFIIRAKRRRGMPPFISPSPKTPALFPTPKFSPLPADSLMNEAEEEWGVDGYGSMNGLIRLRSLREEKVDEMGHESESSGTSDVEEEHVEMERRVDQDLSRFEMILNPVLENQSVLMNKMDDQDAHVAQLEEENLVLKEKVCLMEKEMEDLRGRMHLIGRKEDDSEET